MTFVLTTGSTLQDYVPSRVMVYLKYFFKPWAGDLQLRPGALTPYVDFN
jgi:hypothetical protein